MSTFLEICQKVARESGTISGVQPAAVTSQVGRLLEVVNWVIDAWHDIQSDRPNWLWMRKEFSDVTIASTAKYAATAWSLTSFSRWVVEPKVVTIYLTATGVSDEGELANITWATWRERYGRGTQTEDRPVEYAISPDGQFCLGPIPDAVYTISGEYYEGRQTLAADGDIPNMPERFHDAIVWKALMKLARRDENAEGKVDFEAEYTSIKEDLERDQLPQISISPSSTLA
jgi:hypothetical protein|tara:strand:+ start:9977 stop:10666 length:690 start_codon:yes stop_codon:yes gene_type:complete